MSNNNRELNSRRSNNYRPQSQTRRVIIRTPLTSNRLLYYQLVMGDSPCMFPLFRGGIGSRHLNRFSTIASQGGHFSRHGSQLQASRRLQDAITFAVCRFLRMSLPPTTMSARLRGSRPAPRSVQNRPTTSQPLNNTVVERVIRQEPNPNQESVTESAGTQPYINLLDNADENENDEFGVEEPDLTLKL